MPKITTASVAAVILALNIAPVAAIEQPPARYDIPYLGKADIRSVDISKVKLECAALQRKHGQKFALSFYQYGCSVIAADGTCHVRYPDKNGRGNNLKLEVLRHELAHCNGWSARHEK